MIIFTDCPFPPPTFTSARGAHKQRHLVQNSFQLIQKPWFSTIMLSSIIFTCHTFQPSSISLIRVILFWSVLLSMLLNYKKSSWCLIGRQLSNPIVNEHTYLYPLPPLWRWGLYLDFKRHRESHYSSVFPKTTISTLLSVIIFTGHPLSPPTFTGAIDAHKLHQG